MNNKNNKRYKGAFVMNTTKKVVCIVALLICISLLVTSCNDTIKESKNDPIKKTKGVKTSDTCDTLIKHNRAFKEGIEQLQKINADAGTLNAYRIGEKDTRKQLEVHNCLYYD